LLPWKDLSIKHSEPINSIWNKEELPEQWKESIIVHIYKNGEETD
jgi:hypothetical protein